VLLTGDAEAAAEASMAGADVRAAVLKVGHHGSGAATSTAWLERVRPRIAVISCGAHNSFGHPSPATLERLQHHAAEVYRTDREGAITLELREHGWAAATMLPSPDAPAAR
jgi:beta-lactamase superfamily II metal-dependent hydrolase